MTARTIITGAKHPILRAKSLEVKKIDAAAKKIAKDLIDTLEKIPGIGLAAPQIGHNQRIVLIKLNPGKAEESKIIMINPEIISFSQETRTEQEGCLSLPEIFIDVERPIAITVTYTDLSNRENTLALEHLNARIVQHEIDHLDGILIIDKEKTIVRPDNDFSLK